MVSTTIVKMVLIIVLAGAVTYSVISSVMPAIGNHAASNVSVAFEEFGVYYPLNRSIYTSSPYTPSLTWANGTTTIGNATFNSTHVRLGENETNNATDPATYFAYYTYYDRVFIAGNNYDWVITIIMFVACVAVLMYFLRVF